MLPPLSVTLLYTLLTKSSHCDDDKLLLAFVSFQSVPAKKKKKMNKKNYLKKKLKISGVHLEIRPIGGTRVTAVAARSLVFLARF